MTRPESFVWILAFAMAVLPFNTVFAYTIMAIIGFICAYASVESGK